MQIPQSTSQESKARFPRPKEEVVLAVLPKKHDETKQLHLLFHAHEAMAYLTFASYVIADGNLVLERYCALGETEIDDFAKGAMKGHEMINGPVSKDAPLVECPYLLYANDRKNGTRQVRLTLEKRENSNYLRLSTFEKKNEKWVRRDNEWVSISMYHLNELLNEVHKGKKRINEFNSRLPGLLTL